MKTLVGAGTSIDDSYWDLVTADIRDALRILRPVYDESDGLDGFVSVEVAPVAGPRHRRHRRPRPVTCTTEIAAPNLYVKIPGTAEGVPAIRQMISEGRSINVTLLFSRRALRAR